MNLEIKLADIINFIAIVISPIFALQLSMYIQDRKELRNRKFTAFLTLVSNRHWVANDPQVRAFNSIEVLFHDSAEVRREWREYLELLNQKERVGEWEPKKSELLKKMAISVGLKDTIDGLDLARSYKPDGLANQTQMQNELSTELLRVLKATSALPIDAKKTDTVESKFA